MNKNKTPTATYSPLSSRRKSWGHRRHGVTIIIVIALFAVAMTMIGVWTRSALGHRRQMHRWHQRVQATWLADAGLRRAAARLAREGDLYKGELWQIDAESLSGQAAAEVAIRIEPTDDADRVRIVATADYFSGGKGPSGAEYPIGNGRQVRFTKSTEINLANLGEKP